MKCWTKFGLALILASVLCIANFGSFVEAKLFYQGKRITVIVPFAPGGSYDIHARLLARHLGRNIPGSPSVLVQNMPGGAARIGTNHVFARVPDDPLVILLPHADAYIAQLVGEPGVAYDVSRFNWLGSAVTDTRILVMRSDSPYANLEAMKKAPVKTVPVAITGPGTGSYTFVRLYEHVFDIEFRRVIYAFGPQMFPAVERGEADGLPATLGGFLVTHERWLKEGFVRVLFQGGDKRHKTLPDVPTIYQVTPARHHELIRSMESGGMWDKPYTTGPKVPAEHVQTLREAFMKTMNDPQYREEAAKLGFVIDPVSGAELQRKMSDVVKQSPSVINLMKEFLK